MRKTLFDISNLRASFKGQIMTPDDNLYDAARTVFAGGVDRRPAVIFRPIDANEVSRVVTLAREAGMPLAVKGGGHSSAGHGVVDDGIMLDLVNLHAMEVDVQRKTAWAGAGLTAGEYTAIAGKYGLATGFGDTGSVGIGGITLGGGIGYFVRKYGLTIDDVLAAEIVTADSKIRHVDAVYEPDLFWAIRGGGGNFGVVTKFQYRLHPVSTIVGGMMVFPATADIIVALIEFAAAAPEEFNAIFNVMTAPPMPFLPSKYIGKPVVMALMAYIGDTQSGEKTISQLKKIVSPVADMVRVMAYPEIYPPSQEGYHPIASARTMFMDYVDKNMAGVMLAQILASTASMAVAQVRVLGGAMARIPVNATAFAHRSSHIMVNVASVFQNPIERPVHDAWVSVFAEKLKQTDNGAYVNFLVNEGEQRVHAAYPGATWDKLQRIKTQYDPANLFRLNQNIPPKA